MSTAARAAVPMVRPRAADSPRGLAALVRRWCRRVPENVLNSSR